MSRHRSRWTFAAFAALAWAVSLAPSTTRAQGFAEESPWSVRARLGVEGGAFSGEGVRRESGGVVRPKVEVTPEMENETLRLRIPVSLSHRQTVGAALNDTRGSVGVDARWRFGPSLRLGVDGAVIGVWRPQWSDIYQPVATGGYLPTDRYSHLDGRVGAQIAGIPLRHQHARLKYRFTVAQYVQDPAFEPVLAPTHLAPFNYDEHALEGSWRYLGKGFKAGLGVAAFRRADWFLYSRDADTGATHAGAGGAPPNPMQVRIGIEPGLNGEVRIASGLELSASYGVEVVEDVWEGYYSFTGHHPEVELKFRTESGLEIALKSEAHVRTYGGGSYAAGGSHPPLTFGDRRVDNKIDVGLEVEVPLSQAVTLTGEAMLVRRVTNFPDYEPYVYPATRGYDIDWSYTNMRALVGVRWAIGGSGPAPSED